MTTNETHYSNNVALANIAQQIEKVGGGSLAVEFITRYAGYLTLNLSSEEMADAIANAIADMDDVSMATCYAALVDIANL